jgi:bifunctional DNA-binding transcriptional regulator/antitoxin component of YhaV-PrlF toxin-antitoxin module
MGYKTRVQRIDRKDNRQYYLMCPTALAEALELEKGEEIEWVIERKDYIVLKRTMPGKAKDRK